MRKNKRNNNDTVILSDDGIDIFLRKNTDQHFGKLFDYYVEFLTRSKEYQDWLKLQDEIIEETKDIPLRILPAKINLRKKRKPVEPEEIKKPYLWASVSRNNQSVWDITKKFRCDFNRAILEIDLENPIEILKEQFEIIIKTAQEKYWKECGNENYYGQYRYLVDFMRNEKGKYKGKRKNFSTDVHFDTWYKYLEILDLKQKKLSSREIAEKVFPNEDKIAGENKVNKYFSRAKKLVNAAVAGKFPPKT